MRQFKYNIKQLIEGVRNHPCIWDKNCESYKDKVERKNAWEEIFNSLEENFESMDGEQRRFVEEQIITKWTNMRDTFQKSLKTKIGRPKRRYMFYTELKFLLKGTPQEGMCEETSEDFNTTEGFLLTPKDEEPSEEPEQSVAPRKKSRRTKDYQHRMSKAEEIVEDDCDRLNEFVTCDSANEARLMNEDEAFFASLLPTVVRYSVEERLDFRMEVLNVMKQIHSRRNEYLN